MILELFKSKRKREENLGVQIMQRDFSRSLKLRRALNGKAWKWNYRNCVENGVSQGKKTAPDKEFLAVINCF